MTTIEGEIVSVRYEQPEPSPALWLRILAWWPSLLGLMIGVALTVGSLRC